MRLFRSWARGGGHTRLDPTAQEEAGLASKPLLREPTPPKTPSRRYLKVAVTIVASVVGVAVLLAVGYVFLLSLYPETFSSGTPSLVRNRPS
jgi:hypothetical protein